MHGNVLSGATLALLTAMTSCHADDSLRPKPLADVRSEETHQADDGDEDAGTLSTCPWAAPLGELLWALHVEIGPAGTGAPFFGASNMALNADGTHVVWQFLMDGYGAFAMGGAPVPSPYALGQTENFVRIGTITGDILSVSSLWSGTFVGGFLRTPADGSFFSVDGGLLGPLYWNDVLVAPALSEELCEPACVRGYFTRAELSQGLLGPWWILTGLPIGTNSHGAQLLSSVRADGSAIVSGAFFGVGVYHRIDTGEEVEVPRATEAGPNDVISFLASHGEEGTLENLWSITGSPLQAHTIAHEQFLLFGYAESKVEAGELSLSLENPAAVIVATNKTLTPNSELILPLLEGPSAWLGTWAHGPERHCGYLSHTTFEDARVTVRVPLPGGPTEATFSRQSGVELTESIVCMNAALEPYGILRLKRGVYVSRDLADYQLKMFASPNGLVLAGGFRGTLRIEDVVGETRDLEALGGADDIDSFIAFFDWDGHIDRLLHVGSPGAVAVRSIVVLEDGSYVIAGAFDGCLRLGEGSEGVLKRTVDGDWRDAFVARLR